MEEENRRFSWSGLFIKIILVVIFIIFTVWLISLSTKDMANSLDVLKNDIFSNNLERMKEAGKNYFTKDKLPSLVGDVETITLEQMYKKNLIVEIKDRNGDACSKENSYVSVEKLEKEYQMKVYLECGNEKDFVVVTLRCSDYLTCCPFEENNQEETTNKKPENTTNNNTKKEYEYVKYAEGKWSNWGNWSDWTKAEITKLDNRDVETKVEKEKYTYEDKETKTEYKEFNKTCPTGYALTKDGKQCYKTVTTTKNPSCSNQANLLSQNGFDCKYIEKLETAKTCPTGYDLVGTTCKKTVTTSKTETTNPICPKMNGYITSKRTGFTCTYTKHVKGAYVDTLSSETIPADNDKYIYEEVGNPEYKLNFETGTFNWVHIYNRYESVVATKTGKANCPTGYTQTGTTCGKTISTNSTVEADLYCPAKTGYTLIANSNNCQYKKEVIKTATCPTGYTKSGNTCVSENTTYASYNKACPASYTLTKDGAKCSKEVTTTVTKTSEKNVTYYRYRLREFLNGTPTYKWSSSNSDKNLLNAGYKLTGKTR